MKDLLSNFLKLQSDLKPKLLKTLGIFAQRFEADFMLLVFAENNSKNSIDELLFFGEHPIFKRHLKSVIDFAINNVSAEIPTLKQLSSIVQDTDEHLSYLFIPTDLTDGPRGLVILGFLEPKTLVPETAKQLAYEFMYTHSELLFRYTLQKEQECNDFLLSFGRTLVDVRDCKQLFYMINSSLKPFLNFTDCTIYLFDGHNGTMENLCFNSESALNIFPFKNTIAISTMPIDDIVDNRIFSNVENKAYDFEVIYESRDVLPFLKSEDELAGKNAHIFNLYSGREFIGNCIFLFKSDAGPGNDRLQVVPLIINQIAAAVIRINALKEIVKHKREREILQSLSTDIAFNKDRTTLLMALNPKLKLLFDYTHHFVVAINEDQLTVTGLLADTESIARFHPRYRQVITAKLLISDQVFNKVLLSNDPIVFDLELLATRQTLPDYMTINLESGIKRMAMASLRVGSKIIGIWVICLAEGQYLNQYQLELLKGVSHQLSIAAENIKASEIVNRKNLEREFLSRLSSDITAVRGRKDLDKLFNGLLKTYLAFDHAVIMIRDGEEFYRQLLYSPAIYGLNSCLEHDLTGQRHPITDAFFSKLASTNTISIADIEEMIQEERVPEYLKAEYAAGVGRKVCVKLREGKSEIGTVLFNFKKGTNLPEQDLELYDTISFHLSTAVANVLTNEKISTRERERDLLLTLSTEIGFVKSPMHLLGVITEKLSGFLGFSHVSIGTLNENGETIDILVFDPESKAKNHPRYGELCNTDFPINDGILNKILMSPSTLSFDLDAQVQKNDAPIYVSINRESGIKQMAGIRISKEKVPFGCLLMFFENFKVLSASQVSLINGLSYQVSIAVSNIITNQSLKNKADQESKLILFGSELRTVRDLATLSKILNAQLANLFQVNGTFISVLSEDQKGHQAIFPDDQSMSVFQTEFARLNEEFVEIDGVFDKILHSDDAVQFDGIAPDHHVQYLGTVMKVGQQPIGFIIYGHQDFQSISGMHQLFDSVSSQIAIVISNIRSRQQVEEQLKEIEAYKQLLEEEKIYLTEEIGTIHKYTEIIGESTALKDTFRLVSQVSASDSTVLILGETGTGKELIARAIHNNSPRKNKLMVKVNCAALPVNLIESELFGHERGSFTGATERRLGKFELANNGTLFLDEIGEMPIDLQVKLLRALQEKEIERVGGKETIKVDVRIIAATNRNLETEIAAGRFRADLYYRLNIFPIALPPLRERKQDIEQLSMHFIKQFNKKCGKDINSISSKAMQELLNYDWPGNIRELEHLIERSVLLTSGNVLKHLLLPSPEEQLTFRAQLEEFTLKTIDENEKDYILKILKHCNGRIAGHGGAAEILGVPPTTLNSKIKRLGIKREHTT